MMYIGTGRIASRKGRYHNVDLQFQEKSSSGNFSSKLLPRSLSTPTQELISPQSPLKPSLSNSSKQGILLWYFRQFIFLGDDFEQILRFLRTDPLNSDSFSTSTILNDEV